MSVALAPGTNDNAAYSLGDLIRVAVTFDKNVTVRGSPVLVLDSRRVREALFDGGNETTSLLFSYEVREKTKEANMIAGYCRKTPESYVHSGESFLVFCNNNGVILKINLRWCCQPCTVARSLFGAERFAPLYLENGIVSILVHHYLCAMLLVLDCFCLVIL